MRLLLICLLFVPFTGHSAFLFNYALNYSSQKDDSSSEEYEKTRTFHKVFLGASVNERKTLYFGWNFNSWSSSMKQNTTENTYSILEMGPRVHWFLNENQNWYFSAEWNPYAKGEREKSGSNRDISGSSYGVGLGYRFKISRLIGLGASIHYQSLNISEEKIGSSEDDVSDSVRNIMPMLELTILTR